MVKTIAIIGTTDTGITLAKALAQSPYRLLLFGHDTEKLVMVKSSILNQTPAAEIEVVTCPVDASWEADIIITAVSYEAEKELAKAIKAVATQKIVISISNPLKQTDHGCDAASGTRAAEDLKTLLPHSKLVTVSASSLTNNPSDFFITGTDEEAVDVVKEIFNTAGFQAMETAN